jgi:type III restriction enzyme
MKLVLKEFQEQAVSKLVRHLRGASRDASAGDRQAVCLSSTTGSGKTVMLTRAIELILEGDEHASPMPDATFLWITDQPELNEQTRRKMLSASSVLGADDVVVIDAAFDSETFRAGSVCFLNIQKIGKDKALVTQGDRRTFTIWDVIKNTIEARPGNFFVVIDEAHRGMIEEGDRSEATSIIQKFIKGSSGEIPPAPIVVGISATPDRFNQLIVGTDRMNRPVDVDIADVRLSGLIKDVIVLHHPKKEQPTDMTLLREAAKKLKNISAQWAAYCAKEEDFNVSPLLVVQVEDAQLKGQLSNTDLAHAIQVLRSELGTLPGEAFAHAFQEGATLNFGADHVRYIAPPDIEGDTGVRVVFFKSSLNTGWDCPRAEVMMSFRAATDATNIAQLVGRMVRTPLARRIRNNEVLNSVSLYLPHYDSKSLERVIAKLSRPEDGLIPVDLEVAEDIVELRRAEKTDELFAMFSKLPSYLVPRKRKASQVRRLMKLARLLTNDEVAPDAISSARSALLGVITSAYQERMATDEFVELVEGRRQFELDAQNWDVGSVSAREGDTTKVDISSENIDDLFEASGRKLNEGLHKAWWRERVIAEPEAKERAKIELFVLCSDPELIRRVEATAQSAVQDWLHAYRSGLGDLDESSRAAYDEVRNLAATPELTQLDYPAVIQGRAGKERWGKHMYVGPKGEFSAKFNASEAEVVSRLLKRRDIIGWLRNMDRKPWALCVPYEVDGEDRAMYPDFLAARKDGKRTVVDIIEPHSISLADAPAKAAGLARFSAKHADKFGSIELILIDGKASRSFDLANEAIRSEFLGVKVVEQLRKLMK